MRKRQYTHNQIKAIAIQVVLRAIQNAEIYLDPEFVLATRYDSPTRDDYPYRVEVTMELMRIEQRLRNRLAKLTV